MEEGEQENKKRKEKKDKWNKHGENRGKKTVGRSQSIPINIASLAFDPFHWTRLEQCQKRILKRSSLHPTKKETAAFSLCVYTQIHGSNDGLFAFASIKVSRFGVNVVARIHRIPIGRNSKYSRYMLFSDLFLSFFFFWKRIIYFGFNWLNSFRIYLLIFLL